MSSFGIYLIGIVVLIAGLVIVGLYLKLNTTWIVAGSIVILGVGIISGVSRTRHKDSTNVDG
jgi:hypothetical protein